MTSHSYLLQDNMKGLMVLRRPAELQEIKANKHSPFVSRVNPKEPIGLPPIYNTVVVSDKQANESDLNSKWLKLLKKYPKKGEKKVKNKKKRLSKISNLLSSTSAKQIEENKDSSDRNDIVEKYLETLKDKNEDEKEVINYNFDNKNHINIEKQHKEKEDLTTLERDLKSSNDLKNNLINQRKRIMTERLLEEDNDEEVDKMLNFINNLDYEKYSKDLELREGLYLIKNELDKEKANEIEDPIIEPELEEKDENNSDTVKEEQSKKEFNSYSPDDDKMTVIHDKNWDGSTKQSALQANNEEEIAKTQIAQNILKTDKNMRVIHSINSLKKLLDREGVVNPSTISTLKISVIKERDGMNHYSYKPSILPNLRDLPII